MTDIDAKARGCAADILNDLFGTHVAGNDEHNRTSLIIAAALREAVEAATAESRAEISRLTELPNDLRTCGELSCGQCNARTAQLRAEVERLKSERDEATAEADGLRVAIRGIRCRDSD